MNSKNSSIAGIIIISLFLAGCSSVPEEVVQKNAIDFVRGNVKFFTKESDNVTTVPEYRFESLSSYKEEGNWIVVVHVSADIDGETKQNDVVVTLNKKGEPILFNGQEVPQR